MLFKTFVDQLKFSSLLPQFRFNVSRAKDVLEVYPILLYDEPIVDNKHGVVDNFLELLSLYSLPLEISVAQNGAEIGQ